MSRADVARKARISTPYVGMIENGYRTPPSETFKEILDALGADYTVIGQDEPKQTFFVRSGSGEQVVSALPKSRSQREGRRPQEHRYLQILDWR